MKICIAGYPRSGTNWLQRLMVQTLNGIVPKYKILEHERLEPNRSVNHFIDNPNKSIEVVRVHFLPNNLPDDITYFIYIYRHVFDVFLSSYYYFDMDQKFSLSNYSVFKKVLPNLNKNFKFNSSRNLKTFLYCLYFCYIYGAQRSPLIGFWDQNIDEWLTYCQNNLNSVYLSYEQLRDDPIKKLSDVFVKLSIPYEKDRLSHSVTFQEFNNYKILITKDSSTLKTMWRGKEGTGKKELSSICRFVLNFRFQKTLKELYQEKTL